MNFNMLLPLYMKEQRDSFKGTVSSQDLMGTHIVTDRHVLDISSLRTLSAVSGVCAKDDSN